MIPNIDNHLIVTQMNSTMSVSPIDQYNVRLDPTMHLRPRVPGSAARVPLQVGTSRRAGHEHKPVSLFCPVELYSMLPDVEHENAS